MSKLISMFEVDDRPELNYPGGAEKALECDVVVIGGGGSGLSAAVRAAQKGAKVILVEKMDKLGGNSNFAGGLLATNSKYHQAAGLPDKTEEYIRTNFKRHGYTQNSALVQRYIRNSGKFYEWIVDMGFDSNNVRYLFDTVVLMLERSEPGPLNHPSYGPGIIGSNVCDILKKQLVPLGVTVLDSTKVTKIITDEKGVTGILAKGQDADYAISAKAAILSSGGFGCNMEMLQRFLPEYFGSDNYFTHYCLLSTTGDGIAMAEELGAEIGKNVCVGMEAITHIPGAYSLQIAARCPQVVMVNKNGCRFVAEDDTGSAVKAMDLQPEGICYSIFPEKDLDSLFETTLTRTNFGDRQPTREEYDTDIQKELLDGKLLYGATVAELAEKIGCPAENLEKTLKAYDGFCEKGHDDELLKAPEHLKEMGNGPFYAAKMYRKFDVTMGGVSVNEKIQVVRPDQTPIPGLYATGDVASNWMGTDYGPLFSSFSWAMNSGYLAGEEAAEYSK